MDNINANDLVKKRLNSQNFNDVNNANTIHFSANNNFEAYDHYNILPAEEKLLADIDNQVGRNLDSRLTQNSLPRSSSKISTDRNQYFISDNTPSSIPLSEWIKNAAVKGIYFKIHIYSKFDIFTNISIFFLF